MDNRVFVPPAAVELAKEFELFRSKAYKDPTGRWTVGFGHTTGVDSKTQVGMDFALRLLSQDLGAAVHGVRTLVRGALTDGQLAALVDFVFNLGIGALEHSTLLRKLNAGDVQGAADEFAKWDHMHVDGQVVENARLRERRCAERDLFLGLPRGTSLKELGGAA